MQQCKQLGCFCGEILLKGLDVVFLKAASPQTVEGNVLDARLRSVLKCSVVVLSVKVIVTLSTILMLTVACHCTLLLLLLLQTEKDKVMVVFLFHNNKNSHILLSWTYLLLQYSVYLRFCVFFLNVDEMQCCPG